MKILAICPLKFDGTSFYRAYGIFPHLKKLYQSQGQQFEVHQFYDGGTGYTWADLLSYDVLFLQRPSTDAAKRIKLVDTMKKMGKKIWIDFDDNLFVTPMENRVHYDMKKEVIDAMVILMKEAHLITVSTPALASFFKNMGLKNKIEVVPNAWNFELLPFVDSFNHLKEVPPPQESKATYLWRGSETHQGDIMVVYQELHMAVADQASKVKWAFMGYNPWMITEALELEFWQFIEGKDIMEYFWLLKTMRPQLFWVALRQNEFNFAKSNIAWMEATYCGAACVAPAFSEWKKPGVINYDTPEKFEQIMRQDFVSNASQFEEKWLESVEFIKANLSLDKINITRKQLIDSL